MPATRITWPTIPPRWRTPLTGLFAVVTVLGIVVNTAISTVPVAPEPVDYALFMRPGAALLTGHWAAVYDSPVIQAGPLELAYWGIPSVLGVTSQTAWSVVGIVAGLALSCAMFAVVRWVLRPLSREWSATLAAGVTAIAAFGFLTTRATSSGHPAEFVIPLLWIVSAQLARGGRPFAAAAVMASTSGWELWGLLGVPVLLLAPRIDARTVWRSALGGILVLAVLFVPFFLIGPMRMFSFTWPIFPDTLAHLMFPTSPSFTWPMRLAQGVLAVGAGSAMVLLLRRRADGVWLPLLVVCVVRLVFDPLLAGYYSMPPEVLVLVGLAVALAQRALVPALICLVMANVLIDTRLTLVTASVMVVLTAVLAVLVVRLGETGHPHPRSAPL